MTHLYSPHQSLKEGHWFKLICGASYQHLPAVRNLALTYALAGADCIDVAADLAVIQTTKEALAIAATLAPTARSHGFPTGQPWLMISLNDGEDPHFRKAFFDPHACPPDCPRPCVAICPADAIAFNSSLESDTATPQSGVISDRCYGCGRCLPVCPIQQISTRSHQLPVAAIAPLVLQSGVDALEIHTQVGRVAEFAQLWQVIAPWVEQLQLVAVSCPDGDGLVDYLRSLYEIMIPRPARLLWQTDGRPMSGDIGDGTTHAAIKLGQKVLAAGLPGYVQLAGGTNSYTVPKLRSLNLLPPASSPSSPSTDPPTHQLPNSPTPQLPHISGVAYGSYARVLLNPVLEELAAREAAQSQPISPRLNQPAPRSVGMVAAPTLDSAIALGAARSHHLEAHPDLLWKSVQMSYDLIAPLKAPAHVPAN